jgi:hypothetical protein
MKLLAPAECGGTISLWVRFIWPTVMGWNSDKYFDMDPSVRQRRKNANETRGVSPRRRPVCFVAFFGVN